MINDLFIESKSLYSFEDTIEKLSRGIEENGWKLTAINDLQQTLRNFGKEVLAVKVFSLCHPKHSARILELDEERIVSSLMPCRISIYEKSDGNVYISRMNTGSLAKSIGGIIEMVMVDSTKDVEEILKKLL